MYQYAKEKCPAHLPVPTTTHPPNPGVALSVCVGVYDRRRVVSV